MRNRLETTLTLPIAIGFPYVLAARRERMGTRENFFSSSFLSVSLDEAFVAMLDVL